MFQTCSQNAIFINQQFTANRFRAQLKATCRYFAGLSQRTKNCIYSSPLHPRLAAPLACEGKHLDLPASWELSVKQARKAVLYDLAAEGFREGDLVGLEQ